MTTLVVLLAMLLVFAGIGVWMLRRLVLAASSRARAVSGQAALVLRASSVGPLGEAARLRHEMTRAVKGVRRALRAARAVDAPEGDVASLLARLELAAHEVDGELRMLEGQHDRRRVAAALAGPRTRARAVIDAAGDLVDALLAGADRAASDLSLLQVECSIEADALRGDARRWPHPVREPGPHGPG
jgi:hypothetical protein